MPQRIVALAKKLTDTARGKARDIERVTRVTKILAINALIESAHAGEAGRGFAVVAKEVGDISDQIRQFAESMQTEMNETVDELEKLGKSFVQFIQGTRFMDLALNAIEIMDRNLYERSCDVRWWATDSAMVDLAADPLEPSKVAYASKRLGVILDSYTVYLDLWVVDLNGNVLANGRPEKYPRARGTNVSDQSWFQNSLHTHDGQDYTVADIEINTTLDNHTVATYATAIREGGEVNGTIIGVLGIFFDWGPQAHTVVNGVRLTAEEKSRSKVMLLDKSFRIIASSDGQGILTEKFDLQTNGEPFGSYQLSDGTVVGYALTPGYETYKGLGWYGVITQKMQDARHLPGAPRSPKP